ncbi:MAG: hypothetical protein M3N93_10380, partial [Acidobacteriota bacterium]|nr:hypothetical protein [Acidobacteriota bacterium]
ARVAGSTSSYTGSTIYTHYKLRITETYKGVPAAEVMLPGGVANGYRQSFPGVPTLQSGTEYVLFLWTSQSTGITHVVGLTQGILEVGQATGGTFRVGRPGTGESLLDSSGRPVKDAGIEMALSDLKTRIRTASETTPAPGASK